MIRRRSMVRDEQRHKANQPNRRERQRENIIFSFVSRFNFSSCTFRIFIATLLCWQCLHPLHQHDDVDDDDDDDGVRVGDACVLFQFVAELFICKHIYVFFPFASPFFRPTHSLPFHTRARNMFAGRVFMDRPLRQNHCFLWSDLLAAYKVTTCKLK